MKKSIMKKGFSLLLGVVMMTTLVAVIPPKTAQAAVQKQLIYSYFENDDVVDVANGASISSDLDWSIDTSSDQIELLVQNNGKCNAETWVDAQEQMDAGYDGVWFYAIWISPVIISDSITEVPVTLTIPIPPGYSKNDGQVARLFYPIIDDNGEASYPQKISPTAVTDTTISFKFPLTVNSYGDGTKMMSGHFFIEYKTNVDTGTTGSTNDGA
nr:hypothetical protein [Lachnospiraceae bacterium]